HRHRHPPVLEGPGGVGAFDLQVHLGSGGRRQGRCRHQRGAALSQGDHGIGVVDRQAVAVLGDHATPRLGHQYPSTRRTDRTCTTSSRSARGLTVSARASSLARWVINTSRACSSSSTTCRTASTEMPYSATVVEIVASTPGTSRTCRRIWYRVNTC